MDNWNPKSSAPRGRGGRGGGRGRGSKSGPHDTGQNFRSVPHAQNGPAASGRSVKAPDRGGTSSSSAQRSNNYAPSQAQGASRGASDRPKYPIGYGIIEDIYSKLDSKKLLQGSSELLMAVNVPELFRRLDDLWPHADKREKLLRVIVSAASATQSDLLSMTHDFMMKVLDSGLIEASLKDHVVPIRFSEHMKCPPYTKIAEHLVELLFLGMDRLPTKAEKHLPNIDSATTAIRVCPALYSEAAKATLERLEVLVMTHMTAKTSKMAVRESKPKAAQPFTGSEGPPPEDFRQIPIIPGRYDIVDKQDVFLRPARLVGRYDDDEHYLDVQFRLLREDLVRPLRDGIVAFRSGGLKDTDLFVYRDVSVSHPAMNKQAGDMVCEVKIKTRKKMRWNKRFIYGSLVCFSSDEFRDDLIFAVVKDRDETKIVKGIVGMKFENPDAVDYDAKYIMVESPAFFEAYRHVLEALQAMPPKEPVPFSQYLVELQTDVDVPLYLEAGVRELDFKTLAKIELARKQTRLVDPLVVHHYLKPSWFGMDESQFAALRYALTSELTVIQGPPGTGKTWMGLQLSRLLLDNQPRWIPADDKRPIVVVCYTNHALDQFLEGISQFCPTGIIRVHPPEGPNEPPEEVGQPPPHVRDEFFTTRLDAKKIGEKLAKASAFLKQFEEDIVEPEAIAAGLNAERAVASLNGEDADFSYDADVYTVARSREALVKWLIGGEKICPMNLAKVREFMRRGLPEMAARKASLTFTNTSVEVAADLYRQKRAELEQNAEWQALDNQIRGWPAIATVEALVREAIDSAVALQLLYIAKNNTRKTTSILIDDYRASRAQGAVQAPAAIAEPAVEEPEPDYEELALLREENERDAIEQDALLDDVNWEPVKKQKGSKKIDAQLKTYLPYIKATLPFPEDYQVVTRAEQAQSLVDRWRLYQTWVDEAKFQLEVEMDVLQKEYGTALKRISELRSLGDLAVLKEAKVVGMTTTGAAMHQAALRALKPRIVIVEEAAEVLEAHLLTSLTVACEHAILIGDHKQLRPNPAVYELAKKYNFDVSLFERLIKNQFPYRMLKNQHRMRPEISRTLMPFFYPELEDDASVHGRDNVLGMQKNMVFINHNAPELMDNEVKSHSNPFEAEYAIRLAIYVMQQGYDVSDVTILCTYLEQLLTLRRQAKNHPILDGIRIDNVDNYQGEESKIIILSLVRSTNPRGNIGFLSVPNRVCVALSRAKDGFYVFGNFDFLASKCELWKNIREKVKEKGMLYNYLPVRCQNHGFEQQILTPKDFDAKCPEGGCRTACNVRLDCGHTCEKPCHPLDAEHKQRKCTKPCGRTCAARHPCKKLCFEDCGSCKVKVEKTLPCGHKKVVACGQKPEAVKCPEPCQRSLVCGHRCKEKCSTACTAKCVEPVRRRMPCGHPMTMKCFEKTSEVKCTAKVMKKWSRCNHTTETECSANVDAVPCPKPCDANIPGCEHKCEGTCGQCRNGRLHIQCRKECGRTLICGHPCDSKCSKTCPPCSRPCETACAHSQCSKAGSFDGQQMKLRKNPDHKDHRKKVGRLCGDACPPCLEPCLNRCEHRECSRKCSEPCDVQPCSEPCKKPLKCSPKEEGAEPHLCIGVCGEDCIDVCRVCDPEKFAELREIFLGSEEEEDARFVRLKDCSHVFEVSGLDKCVQGALGAAKKAEEQQIVTIRCPKCSTPIRRSKRYAHILSQRATDIEQGKRVVRGSDKDALTLEWREYLEEFRRFFKSYQDLIEPSVKAEYNYTKDGSLIAFGHDLKFMLKQFEELSAASITSAWMNTARNTLRVLERMCKLIKAICDSGASRLRGQGGVPASMPRLRTVLQTELPISVNMPCLLTFLQTKVPKYGDLWKYVADDFCFLLDVIRNKEHLKPSQAVSDTLLQQFSYECQRLSFIIDLAKWIVKAVDYGRDLDQTAAATLKAILGTLDCGKEFVGEHERIMKHYMEMLMNQHKLSGFTLSQQEIVEIPKALGSHVTQWYRCSKGHVYGIGECGMAMVRSRCPECKEEIGGEDHRLVATSQQALEMTGGRPPSPPPNPFVVRFGPEW